MTLTLNHYSIRTTDMVATERFYVDVLGLTVGPRPPFPFPGLWLYRGPHNDIGNAVVHVIGIDLNDPEGLQNYLGDRDIGSLQGSGAVDHVAFFADGLEHMLDHLKRLKIEPRQRTVPEIHLHQLFLNDPSGVVVELNYPSHEKLALDSKLATLEAD
jgi:catechol 2,3-dioxygenase-like lactoylglutathione lyase family enzyme